MEQRNIQAMLVAQVGMEIAGGLTMGADHQHLVATMLLEKS